MHDVYTWNTSFIFFYWIAEFVPGLSLNWCSYVFGTDYLQRDVVIVSWNVFYLSFSNLYWKIVITILLSWYLLPSEGGSLVISGKDGIQGKYILSWLEGSFEDKSANLIVMTEDTITIILCHLILHFFRNSQLYFLYFGWPLMQDRQIHGSSIDTRNGALVSIIVQWTLKIVISFKFFDISEYFFRRFVHSSFEQLLNVIFRCSSDTVMMLHHWE